ncbi:MAG: hypothetical protein J6K32_06190 [Clostridia bacterium]|nr:hypothetical protein [Clostridia bacterium]
MPGKINGEKLKLFLYRRKTNTLGLFLIAALSVAVTLICALIGFPRTDILAGVSLLLILLCIVQLYRLRKSFRTIPSFKGQRKKRKAKEEA